MTRCIFCSSDNWYIAVNSDKWFETPCFLSKTNKKTPPILAEGVPYLWSKSSLQKKNRIAHNRHKKNTVLFNLNRSC